MDISIRCMLHYIDIHFFLQMDHRILPFSFLCIRFSVSSHESYMNLSRTNHRLPLVSVSSLRTPLAVSTPSYPPPTSVCIVLTCENVRSDSCHIINMFPSKALILRECHTFQRLRGCTPFTMIPPTVFDFQNIQVMLYIRTKLSIR
jgi:hypothetical protein